MNTKLSEISSGLVAAAVSVPLERRVRQTVTMKCEHCGRPAMRRWIICKRCWKIFVGEE